MEDVIRALWAAGVGIVRVPSVHQRSPRRAALAVTAVTAKRHRQRTARDVRGRLERLARQRFSPVAGLSNRTAVSPDAGCPMRPRPNAALRTSTALLLVYGLLVLRAPRAGAE